MATIIDLGKIRFEYQGVYSGSKVYEWNDVVKYGGNVYVYKYGTALSGNVPTNTTYWDLMMEGFNFEGVYNAATTYVIGDGFSYGGTVYVVTADTVTGVTPPSLSHYSKFVDGLQYEGVWDSASAYQLSDIVTHGGTSYVAKRDTTSEVPSAVDSAWDVFSSGLQVEGTYSAAASYQKDDIVTYGGTTYKALQDVSGTAPSQGSPNWEQFVGGFDLKDSFDSATAYVKNDIVRFGGNLYKAKGDITGTHPIDTIYWESFLDGQSFVGNYDAARKYYPGEVILAGGQLFIALLSSTGSTPAAGSNWRLLIDSVQNGGTWSTGQAYLPGTLLKYGGTTYIVDLAHTSGSFASDLSTSKLLEFAEGVRNRGTWGTSTLYVVNDIVQTGTSSYIAQNTHTSTSNFANDESDGRWAVFAAGGSGALPTITAADVGKSIVVKNDASGYELDYTDNSPNTFYISTDGVDSASSGISSQKPFATIKYAMDHITALKSVDSTALVLIKEGSYEENLPITVPTNTTVTGSGQRSTFIKPQSGDEQETMFFLNSGVMIKELVFAGLTGFTVDSDNPDHIENATVGGVYLRLDPTAVITKSPYVKECSAFSTGGVGAIVDGGLNADPNNAGSMVFHTYTQIHNGGVGFWIRRKGKAEIVSCFTYYCDFGYAASDGGFIRSLNGNNSYGRYGAVSYGFDSAETTNNGNVRGYSLDYQDGTNLGGDFANNAIVKSPDRLKQVSFLTRSSPIRIGTKEPHGLSDGHLIRVDPQLPASWASFDETTEYYADIIDSNTMDLYTNTGLSNPADGTSIGGRSVTNVGITDITRSNPMTVTVASHSFDSWDLLRIQNVGGMTQVNNQHFSVHDHTASTINLREAEHSHITVAKTGADYTLTGTIGGQSYSASVEPNATLYRGSKYLFDIDSSVSGAFYLTTTDSTGWSAVSYSGEYTTGVRNSRATAGNRMVIEVDSSAPNTLHYANSGTGTLHGEFTIVDPSDVNATSYSVYTSGGTLRLTDSGDDLDSAQIFAVGPRATVINHQPGANKIIIDNIIGTGFIDGDSIEDSAGVVSAILSDSDTAHDQYGFTMAFDGFTAAKPRPGGSLEFVANVGDSGYDSIGSYVIQTVTDYDSATGNVLLVFAQEKTSQRPAAEGQSVKIRYNYSQARLTGHDFLSIGTGDKTQTNYPGDPLQPSDQSNEVLEQLQGRVYYVSTDQDGNFRVGNYFRIDQATGRATLDASAFDLSGLTSLRLGSIGAQLGASINEFSTDGTLSGNSTTAVPTESAVKTYVDTKLEGASSLSLPANAKSGALATELFMGFNIYDVTKNDGKNLK